MALSPDALEELANRYLIWGSEAPWVAYEETMVRGVPHIVLLNYAFDAKTFVELMYPIPCLSPHHEGGTGFQLKPSQVFDRLPQMSPHFQERILTFLAKHCHFAKTLRPEALERLGRLGEESG